jgi:hypothetical protein
MLGLGAGVAFTLGVCFVFALWGAWELFWYCLGRWMK